jgi:hypothetical protein
MYDVYLYGMITASTVYILDDAFVFPQPNHYAEIKQSFSSIGGEAVNSAIMLSKFGVKTKLDGNWLNRNTADKIFNLLKPFDIDSTRLTIQQNCGPEEIVITDRNSRTIFGNFSKFHSGNKQWNAPTEEDIQHAAMIGLDPYFKEEALRTAHMCVQNKKPYVTLDCRYDDFIAQNAAAIIISQEVRDQVYPDRDMLDIFEKYKAHCSGLIIFTFGSDELWYARKGQQLKKINHTTLHRSIRQAQETHSVQVSCMAF